LHRWLTHHRRLGPPLDHWRRHRAISMRAKRSAVFAMGAVPAIAFALGTPLHLVGLQCLVLVVPAAFVLTRPQPPHDGVAPEREESCGPASQVAKAGCGGSHSHVPSSNAT